MKVLVVGDYCPQRRVSELFKREEYGAVLGEVKDVIECADYSIVNLECPVTIGDEKPIVKCGRNLNCSEKGIDALNWAGFNCVTLANNHFLDFGPKGVENTLRVCRDKGVDTVGGGLDLKEASKILYKSIQGEILAIINCCEHEFSIATEISAGSNPLNAIDLYYKIEEAKKHAEYVLCIVHGGNEHYQHPSPRMQETYRFLIDVGADAVVNHHQHCVCGYEVYKNKPIFYGLGNFCFDNDNQRNSQWNVGYFVVLSLQNSQVSFNLSPYCQCDKTPSVKQMSQCEINRFNELIVSLNEVLGNKERLKSEYQKYLDSFSKEIQTVLEPYTSKYAKALFRKGLLPSLISRKKEIELLAYIECESHYPKVINYLQKK